MFSREFHFNKTMHLLKFDVIITISWCHLPENKFVKVCIIISSNKSIFFYRKMIKYAEWIFDLYYPLCLYWGTLGQYSMWYSFSHELYSMHHKFWVNKNIILRTSTVLRLTVPLLITWLQNRKPFYLSDVIEMC